MNTSEIISQYSGTGFYDKLKKTARDVVLSNLEYMRVAFGENVEYQRLFHQTLLCDATVDYL